MSLPVTYPESELIFRLRQGEESAYGYLYDHYGAAIYGIILKIVGRPVIAEDLLQEVFLKVYHHLDQYDPSKGRLFTWILNISRNLAIDTIRSKDFKQTKEVRELDNDVDNNAESPSSFLYVDHLGLEKVLTQLNKEQQELIELAYFKGYTQEEISKELKLPLGTVKTRIRGALIQLRKILNIS